MTKKAAAHLRSQPNPEYWMDKDPWRKDQFARGRPIGDRLRAGVKSLDHHAKGQP